MRVKSKDFTVLLRFGIFYLHHFVDGLPHRCTCYILHIFNLFLFVLICNIFIPVKTLVQNVTQNSILMISIVCYFSFIF